MEVARLGFWTKNVIKVSHYNDWPFTVNGFFEVDGRFWVHVFLSEWIETGFSEWILVCLEYNIDKVRPLKELEQKARLVVCRVLQSVIYASQQFIWRKKSK